MTVTVGVRVGVNVRGGVRDGVRVGLKVGMREIVGLSVLVGEGVAVPLSSPSVMVGVALGVSVPMAGVSVSEGRSDGVGDGEILLAASVAVGVAVASGGVVAVGLGDADGVIEAVGLGTPPVSVAVGDGVTPTSVGVAVGAAASVVAVAVGDCGGAVGEAVEVRSGVGVAVGTPDAVGLAVGSERPATISLRRTRSAALTAASPLAFAAPGLHWAAPKITRTTARTSATDTTVSQSASPVRAHAFAATSRAAPHSADRRRHPFRCPHGTRSIHPLFHLGPGIVSVCAFGAQNATEGTNRPSPVTLGHIRTLHRRVVPGDECSYTPVFVGLSSGQIRGACRDDTWERLPHGSRLGARGAPRCHRLPGTLRHLWPHGAPHYVSARCASRRAPGTSGRISPHPQLPAAHRSDSPMPALWHRPAPVHPGAGPVRARR